MQSDSEEVLISPEKETYFELVDQSAHFTHRRNSHPDDDGGNSEAESSNQVAKVMHIKPVKTNKARWLKRDPLIGVVPDERRGISGTAAAAGGKTVRVKRIFNEQKPMKVCDICGNQYKYKHALDSHLRRHRNDKPYTCRLVAGIAHY